MNNALSNLTSSKFWFSSPQINSSELRIYFFIFLALVILWLICYIVFTGKAKKIEPYLVFRNSFGYLLGFGIIGLVLTFFAWQAIPYLSSRILFIILFISIAMWFTYKILDISKFKERIEEFEEEQKSKQYLPRKKSK